MRSTVLFAAIVATAAMVSPAGAVSLGEIDTFSGSIEQWFAGGGPGGAIPDNSPRLESSGGPGGARDFHLRIKSVGSSGRGSKLVAMNASQWAGDYLAAGITAIEMDVNNFGPEDVLLRLLFEDLFEDLTTPLHMATTTTGVMVPANSGWRHVRIGISPGELTAITGTITAALSSTTVLRLLHNSTATFPPDAISTELGVDNITAVPEPAAVTSMLAGLAFIGVLAWLRRRRRLA